MCDTLTGVHLCLTGGTNINSIILRFSTNIINVQGWKLDSILQGRYVQYISAKQNACPYLSAYYLKTINGKEMVRFWRMEMEKGGNLGEASTWYPQKQGKPGKNPLYIHD